MEAHGSMLPVCLLLEKIKMNFAGKIFSSTEISCVVSGISPSALRQQKLQDAKLAPKSFLQS